MKIRLTAVLMVVGLTVSYASSLAAQTSGVCDDTKLPTAAKELLTAKFPLWRPKHVSDLDPFDQRLWLKKHTKECPGITVGLFESAEQFAYAVLLVPKAKLAGGYKIIVVSGSQSGDAYTSKILDHAEGQAYPELVISTAAPGKYSDFEDTKSVKLKLDSIYVEWIEKGAVLYYWSAARYHHLQVSD